MTPKGRRPAGAGRPASNRNLAALLAITATNHGGFDFATPFLPLFVLSLGLTGVAAATWSGLLVGATPFCGALMAPVWGVLTDRYGGKHALNRVILVAGPLLLATVFITDLWGMLAVRIAIGLCAGFTVVALAMAAQSVPPERMGQALGLMQTVQFAALAAIPPLAGLLIDRVGLQASFGVGALLVFLGWPILHLWYQEPPRAAAPPRRVEERPGRRRAVAELLATPGLAAMAAVVVATQFVERSFAVSLPLIVAELEPGSERLGFLSGLVLGAGSLAVATSSALLGRLARVVGPRRLLLLALAGGAALLAPLAIVRSVEELLVLRLLLALCSGGLLTLAYTATGQSSAPGRVASAYGVLGVFTSLGSALSPMLLGPISTIGLRAVFVFGAAALALACLAVAFLARPAEAQPQRAQSAQS